MNRIGTNERKTRETNVKVNINLDGTSINDISTGIPFFDHMLEQLSVHGVFDLHIKATGDLDIDPHHLIEDVGISLGKAIFIALGTQMYSQH